MRKVVIVLSLLGLVSVIGFYLPKKAAGYIKATVSDLQTQNDSLKKEIESLEERLSKLEKREPQVISKTNIKTDFKKWNCWCDLRKKLETDEDFSSELKNFKTLFADHPDLLKMVEKLTEMPQKNDSEGNNSNSLVNNLLKFAKIRKVDKNELLRISGYVLMLTFTVEDEENER